MLADSVALARANLDAYETTGKTKFLERAERLMNIVDDRLRAEDGGYYDSLPDENMPPATRIRHRQLADNAQAAEVLARLNAYTAKGEYLDRAKSALAVFEKQVEDMLARGAGYFASEFAIATRYVSNVYTKITIVGSRDDTRTIELLRKAKRIYQPAKVVQLLDPWSDMPLINAMKYDVADVPVAYVCAGASCSPPVKEAEQLLETLGIA
jgi:hypothetical protein